MSVGQRVTLARADCIVPEYQRVEVGAQVKLAPEVALPVAVVEPQCALVLRGGIPMGPMQAPYDFTWAFVLRVGPGGSTRLVVRECYGVFAQVGPVGRGASRTHQPRDEPANAAQHQEPSGERSSLRSFKPGPSLTWATRVQGISDDASARGDGRTMADWENRLCGGPVAERRDQPVVDNSGIVKDIQYGHGHPSTRPKRSPTSTKLSGCYRL